jgi:hypothetical protein
MIDWICGGTLGRVHDSLYSQFSRHLCPASDRFPVHNSSPDLITPPRIPEAWSFGDMFGEMFGDSETPPPCPGSYSASRLAASRSSVRQRSFTELVFSDLIPGCLLDNLRAGCGTRTSACTR